MHDQQSRTIMRPALSLSSGPALSSSSGSAQSLALILILLLTAAAIADDYYVSPTGSDSNTGTIDYPFAAIPTAISAASAGDTIYLRAGTYSYSSKISISCDGTSAAMYTMQAYPDEVAILDFSGTSTGTRGIELSGDYWHLYDFIIQNAGDNGLYITGTNNTVELIVTRCNEDSGIQLHTGAADNLILNCDSYENYDPSNHGENADGFATKFGLGTGNILRNCRAWSNSDDGYDCWNSDPPSEAVTYDHCWAFRNGIDLWDEGTSFAGDGNGFKLGAGAGGHELLNCVAYDNPHNGIDVNGNTTGVHVYNCNAIMNGTTSGSNFRFDEYNSAHILRNNISYLADNVIYDDIDDACNSWNGFTVTDDDFVTLDPTGIDGDRQSDGSLPELTFMRLASTSPLIDAGTDVGLSYEGTAPDLGAYEYTGQSYPPAAPTGLTAAIGCNMITLDWDDNTETDLVGYNVYRSTDPQGTFTILPEAILLTSSNFVDTDVSYTTTYYYVVTAENDSSLESADSDQVSERPTFYGDFIVNRSVEEDDLAYLMDLWLQDDCETTFPADLGDDCVININEFSAFARNWKLIESADIQIIIQENETGLCSFDGVIESEHSGHTGSGYINTDNASGSGIDYSVEIFSAGTYTFTCQYANGSSDRPGRLLIDDTEVQSVISFPATGAWTTWTQTAAVQLTLTTGLKDIRIEATGSAGLANIDYIQIEGPDLEPAACP